MQFRSACGSQVLCNSMKTIKNWMWDFLNMLLVYTGEDHCIHVVKIGFLDMLVVVKCCVTQ